MPGARSSRLAARVLLAGFCTFAAAKALQLGATELAVRDDPAQLLALDRGNPQAVLRLARSGAPDAAADAQRSAEVRAALARAPADGRLWRELAAAAGPGTAAGQDYLQIALRLRPADVRTRAWLADNAAAQDDLSTAAVHLDAILRVAPQYATSLFPLLQAWLRRSDGTNALVAVFAQAPPWRRGFFAAAPAAPQRSSVQALARLLLALRRSAAPPDLGEGIVVVDRLLALGDYERAWLLWQALQPAERRVGPLLRNGQFEDGGIGSGFDWVLRRGSGANAMLATAPQGDSRALRIRFDERPLQGAAAAQTVLLAPGRYRLDGRLFDDQQFRDRRFADHTPREAALEWTIDCVAPRAQRLAATAPATEAARQWSTFSLEFRVPDADCTAQRLQLQPRAPGLRGAGELWFDALTLSAAPQTAAAP